MAVGNNRSQITTANRQRMMKFHCSEKSSFAAFDWTKDVFYLAKIYRSAFSLVGLVVKNH